MKNKILSLFVMSVFIVAVFAGLASAAISLNPNSNSQSINKGSSGSFTFTIENTAGDGSEYQNFTSVISDLTGTAGTISSSQVTVGALPTSLPDGNTSSSISVTMNVPSTQAVGAYTGTITIDADGTVSNPNSQVISLTVTVTQPATPITFCSNGEVNKGQTTQSIIDNLVLNVDINNRGEGDDEEWFPLDRLEIEVELENKNDDFDFDGDGDSSDGDGDLDDVILQLGLFREGTSSDVADEMNWISKDDEEYDVGNIDEDESDKWTFEFKVNPKEVEDANYRLFVKAYEKGDEDVTCIDTSADLGDFGSSENYAEIQINLESDVEKMVVVDEDSVPQPINAFCGSGVSFTADVWNIGEDDFPDQIEVQLTNSELGLDLSEIINGDFDAGDDSKVTFTFNVPSDAIAKIYTLEMRTLYDYDKDDDTYDEFSEDTFFASLKVEGDCSSSSSSRVTASLESGGKAGEDLVVKAIVTNDGTKEGNYVINVAGHSGFASSATVVPTTFTLAAGASRDVTITLPVKDDASGEYTFNIEAISGSQVTTQPLTVNIEGKKTGFLTGGAIGANGLAWGLGILSLILIVAIIIVAMRLRN